MMSIKHPSLSWFKGVDRAGGAEYEIVTTFCHSPYGSRGLYSGSFKNKYQLEVKMLLVRLEKTLTKKPAISL